jgi:hypothetical protein
LWNGCSVCNLPMGAPNCVARNLCSL